MNRGHFRAVTKSLQSIEARLQPLERQEGHARSVLGAPRHLRLERFRHLRRHADEQGKHELHLAGTGVRKTQQMGGVKRHRHLGF